jgi:hypothetical protein
MNTLKHAPHTAVKLDIERRYVPKIISLLNSAHYLLSHAIIVFDKDRRFHLLVEGRGTRLTDEVYNSLKGARIAFSKIHQIKALNNRIKPLWSKPYRPDIQWLDKKLSGTQTEMRRDN